MAIQRLDNLTLFMALLPVLGFFTNGVFALYTIWLPEMFPSSRRGRRRRGSRSASAACWVRPARRWWARWRR